MKVYEIDWNVIYCELIFVGTLKAFQTWKTVARDQPSLRSHSTLTNFKKFPFFITPKYLKTNFPLWFSLFPRNERKSSLKLLSKLCAQKTQNSHNLQFFLIFRRKKLKNTFQYEKCNKFPHCFIYNYFFSDFFPYLSKEFFSPLSLKKTEFQRSFLSIFIAWLWCPKRRRKLTELF